MSATSQAICNIGNVSDEIFPSRSGVRRETNGRRGPGPATSSVIRDTADDEPIIGLPTTNQFNN